MKCRLWQTMVGLGHVHAERSTRDPHGVVSCLERATRDRLRVVSPGPYQLRAPAKLFQEPGAGTDPEIPSSHAFAVGLVRPDSKLRHSNLIRQGDGALVEGQGGWQQRCSAEMLTFGLPGLGHLEAMGCAASGQPARCQNPPSVHAGGWMSPARGRQIPSTDLGFFAWVTSSLALLQRVQMAFLRAIIEGSTWHAFQHGAPG